MDSRTLRGVPWALSCSRRCFVSYGWHRNRGVTTRNIPRTSKTSNVTEVILALGATVNGQITAAHLQANDVIVSALAHGMPVGGELEYLDDGTILSALRGRRPLRGDTILTDLTES